MNKERYEYIMSNLNMISRIALMEEAKLCRQCIDELMEVLRYSEDKKDKISTTTQEIEIINKNLHLYKNRMGNRFNVIVLNNIQEKKIYVNFSYVACNYRSYSKTDSD